MSVSHLFQATEENRIENKLPGYAFIARPFVFDIEKEAEKKAEKRKQKRESRKKKSEKKRGEM